MASTTYSPQQTITRHSLNTLRQHLSSASSGGAFKKSCFADQTPIINPRNLVSYVVPVTITATQHGNNNGNDELFEWCPTVAKTLYKNKSETYIIGIKR